ncbi:MAG: ATP-binding protein [Sedimentibacter sp.]|uniref:ATP-binding protein n=1 Tax=Sedimentibacter sp. TaxID=1960295 RepID=UPI0031594283
MKDVIETFDALAEWDSFIAKINKNPTARYVTQDSWNRCKEYGINPEKLIYKFLSKDELVRKLREHSRLIEISKPYMDSISLSLAGKPHMVALSDKDGWIIDSRGVPEELGGKKSGLCIGASWAEMHIGNNGIGTALSLKQPVLVYGTEHFSKAYSSYACMGVPIICNGNVIGAMDISVPEQFAHPNRMNILVACASSIESVFNYINNFTGVDYSAIGDLISTAVHDLKNPLAVISGLGQLGNITSDEAKIKGYFDRIVNQADEMNKMVTELLNIFKPEELISQKIDSVIEEVLNIYKPICESKKVKLSFEFCTDKPVVISRKLIKRTIENIVNNAVQVIEHGGFISVKTYSNGQSLFISIEDTAGGIPEDMQDILFEPFVFRRGGGTGLGLFMAYFTVTKTHKGKIWFETKQGVGTTFFIELPLAAKHFEN